MEDKFRLERVFHKELIRHLEDKQINRRLGPFLRRDLYNHLITVIDGLMQTFQEKTIYFIFHYGWIYTQILAFLPFIAGLGFTKYLPSSRVNPLNIKIFKTSWICLLRVFAGPKIKIRDDKIISNES